MIILTSAHNKIVKALEARLADAVTERDYYRRIVLGDRALPDPSPAISPVPVAATVIDESPQLGIHWTNEEKAAYGDWCQIQVRLHGDGDPERLRRDYYEMHGNLSPIELLAE